MKVNLNMYSCAWLGSELQLIDFVAIQSLADLHMTSPQHRTPFYSCGVHTGLGSEEQLWLARKINSHVERLTGNKPPEQPPPPRALRSRGMDMTGFGGPMVGGPGVFGGRVWGGPSSLDSPAFWDDSMDDDD
jgi:hypothetical protein